MLKINLQVQNASVGLAEAFFWYFPVTFMSPFSKIRRLLAERVASFAKMATDLAATARKSRPANIETESAAHIIGDEYLPYNRRPGKSISTVVLHHSAGSGAENEIRYMAGLKSPGRVSYHYVVARDGRIYKTVPVSGRAWHAGSSAGPDGADVNDYSIGVCMSNRGTGEPYPPEQIRQTVKLLKVLKANIPTLEYLTPHFGITNRKIDPAYCEPKRIAEAAGLRFWSMFGSVRPVDFSWLQGEIKDRKL